MSKPRCVGHKESQLIGNESDALVMAKAETREARMCRKFKKCK